MTTEARSTLLVVDDAVSNIDILLDALSEGYNVRVSTDGAAALRSVKKAMPDLILLDIMMPDMDGFEVCRRLKDDPAARHIPIIFLTALNEITDEAHGFDLGAADYITKPFNLAVVKARVHNHLELKRHRDHLEELIKQRTFELELLTGRLAEAEERQLMMISRELHDQIGQNLNTIGLNLAIIKSLIYESTPDIINSHLDDSLSIIKDTSIRIRNLMAEIRSPVLDDYGLLAALRHYGDQYSHRTGVKILIRGIDLHPRPPAHVESALYRIAQEALTNISKHARATEVLISLKRKKRNILIIIEDNGIGYDNNRDTLKDNTKGWGLITMKERALAVKGSFRVESRLGGGTRVTVEAPI